jgi:hypothetical protein
MAKKSTDENKAPKAEWSPLSADQYRSTAATLVHFSTKTVNSNARAGGVRLTAAEKLNLPYVSARTALAAGRSLALDYTANSGKTATVVKQMRAVAKGEIDGAPTEEVSWIEELLEICAHTGASVGLEPVDPRLRQVLIPKTDAPGGYVSLTPLTAGGICEQLIGRGGLVEAHETARKAETTNTRLSLKRANLGIGGANPQNVGALVRSMQRPLLAPIPRARGGIRSAFSVYHRGIRLPQLRPFALSLRELREQNSDDGVALSNVRLREAQATILRALMQAVLAAGDAALQLLLDHADVLPQDHRLGDGLGHELVSRNVRAEIRGLIDPRLREPGWAYELAQLVVHHLQLSTIRIQGEDIAVLVLDGTARAGLIDQLAEMAR